MGKALGKCGRVTHDRAKLVVFTDLKYHTEIDLRSRLCET